MTQLLTAADCSKKYGNPNSERHLGLLVVTDDMKFGPFHSVQRIYCNHDMMLPLQNVLREIKASGLEGLIRTYNGCFNIRKSKGSSSKSLHSWGVAIDLNSESNQYGKPPTMDTRIVEIFDKHGFDWGGIWKTPDGMHFQLKRKLVFL